ncbi:MAG TPA: hypothetical protein VF600_05735 [Abditibacteriaceae bacterium]|jgi:hypothetical protein
MNCQRAKSSFATLSVEEMTSPSMRELQEHLAQCPPCLREWHIFQQTLLIVSTTTQPVPSAECSQAMWQECARCCMEKTEKKRLEAQRPAWWRSPLGQWMSTQPRWGWAALGGSLAILGAVWFLTPQNNTAPTSFATTDMPAGTFIRFERPPSAASPFINHHSAMAFDPFADHVGSTLVSYSATAPQSDASPPVGSAVVASPATP